eukprot:299194-Rhodomonas_salina.1
MGILGTYALLNIFEQVFPQTAQQASASRNYSSQLRRHLTWDNERDRRFSQGCSDPGDPTFPSWLHCCRSACFADRPLTHASWQMPATARGLNITVDSTTPSALPLDSPCAEDAGSDHDEVRGRQEARWDDRNPFATVEMFRHTHKPSYQAAPLHSIHSESGGARAAWDDRRPVYTANLFEKIRPTRA